jgi:amidohydrolase
LDLTVKSIEDLKSEVLDEIDAFSGRAFEINRSMYENPEVGPYEYDSSKLLASELEKHGFEVERGLADLETSFNGVFRGKPGGPTVAILAEYDALPGVGHGCGHNIIGTAALTAGIALSKVISKIPGTVMVVGTPFEEGGARGGKIPMVEEGVFDGVDAAMYVHPFPSVKSDGLVHSKAVEITSLALGAVEIKFKGRPTHASGSPELGINALDAVIQTFNGLNALRQHIRSDSRIHGIITDGGKAPNVVPEEAAAYFFVRSPEKDYMWELMAKLKKCAEGAALATGAELVWNQNPYHMAPLKPNFTITRLLEKNLEGLGERVEEPEEKRRGGGSTDFGNVTEIVPGGSARIAICPKGVLGHSKDLADATVSEKGEHGLILGAKTMALSTLDLLTNKKLLDEAKEEFKSS